MKDADIHVIPRTSANQFGTDGVSRDAHGIPHYDNLPASLPAVLRHWAETTPDADAIVEIGGPRLSYQQLFDGAARVAGGLRAAGLGPGQRVALRYPAGASWVLAFWGSILAGGIPVAVNTRFAAPEVAFVLADAGVTIDLGQGDPLPDAEPYVGPEPGHDDIAALFYTSGTTGNPKGVPTTHEAFLSNAESMIRCMGITPGIGSDLRTLISVPLFHVTGCNSQLLTAAYVGGASVILPALNLDLVLSSLSTQRISFMVTVPAVYSLLLRHESFAATDTSSVRWVGYGGAPIAASLVRKLIQAFPSSRVFNGYGMTETASLMSVLPHSDAAEHADSVGFAVPVVDLAVHPLGSPSHGELLARGPNITAGYWNRPEANAETFAGGWLHTGDIVDVDGDGRIAIVDRLKDIINRGGENISSVEVENALTDAPGVAEVAVVGVPDDVMGEKVGAVVVATGDSLDVASIVAHAKSQLADYKIPQFIAVVPVLPRNAAGKVRKAELRRDTVWGDPLS